jgi:hypothetical protein
MLRKHSESWQRDISVQSKYVILILWPTKDYGVNMNECQKSLQRVMQTQEECISKSNLYFLLSGFDQLRSLQQAKKFSKTIHELCIAYYRQKKENVKNKIKKLIVGQI